MVAAGAALPRTRPVAWVVDLDPDRAAGSSWFERLCGRIDQDAACIYLARDAGTRGVELIARLGSPTVVPARLQAHGVVATLVRAIDRAHARALQTPTERGHGRATGLVDNLFTAAALGRAPSADEADESTQIVLDAISDVGVRAWLELIWRHDVTVYQHSLGVAGFAAAFAGELGFSRADRHRLAKAALLHDVGKARVPLAVLNKPGALNLEETLVMRAHTAIGGDLLAATGRFEPDVIDVARHHHERLDGSGYPAGLQGAAVGDLARLVAICDVHSALTERRVYRRAMTGAEARAVMDGMAGQLDAGLLRAYRPVMAQCEGVEAAA